MNISEHHNFRQKELSELVTCVLSPDVRGVRLEKLLTARLWPRCLRLQAVRHLESMLCLIRYQSDSEMPNLWNKWPADTNRRKMLTRLTISMISKPCLQMFLIDYINWMSTVKCNIHHKIVVSFFWGNILLHIIFSLRPATLPLSEVSAFLITCCYNQCQWTI